MTEHALLLLDHATRLPDVSQAFVVADDRTVMGASNRGEPLPDPDACLAVYDTLQGLSLYQLETGQCRWNFPGRTLILHRSAICTFGAFVASNRADSASKALLRQYRQFVADVEADAQPADQPLDPGAA